MTRVILFLFLPILFLKCGLSQDQQMSVIPTLQEINDSKGKLKVEDYYPVDLNSFLEVKIYLDSSFKFTKDGIYKGVYFINQKNSNGIQYGKLKNKKPNEVKIIAFEKIAKEFDFGLEYIKLIDATFIYKRIFKTYEYKIENSYLKQIHTYKNKNKRLISTFDLTGLYKEVDKFWPTLYTFQKNGNVSHIHKYVIFDDTTYILKCK